MPLTESETSPTHCMLMISVAPLNLEHSQVSKNIELYAPRASTLGVPALNPESRWEPRRAISGLNSCFLRCCINVSCENLSLVYSWSCATIHSSEILESPISTPPPPISLCAPMNQHCLMRVCFERATQFSGLNSFRRSFSATA